MKTPRIKTLSVRDYQKQQKQLMLAQQKLNAETRFKEHLSKVAKSLLPSGFKVKLSVIEADTFAHESSVMTATTEVMGKSSVWAPWSPNYKK